MGLLRRGLGVAALARQLGEQRHFVDQIRAEQPQVPVPGMLVMDAHLHHDHVDGQHPGVVGHDQGRARVRHVLQPAHPDPEPVLVEPADHRHEHRGGELGVEPELIGLVAAAARRRCAKSATSASQSRSEQNSAARGSVIRPGPVRLSRRHDRAAAPYFLFLRWMRVFLSSLRCFFLAIRLRRFLMTEPTAPPSASLDGTGNGHARPPVVPGAGHSPGKAYRPAVLQHATSPAQRRPAVPAGCPRVPSDQVSSRRTKASLRYWFTACSGTRKERPTRIASSSPE